MAGVLVAIFLAVLSSGAKAQAQVVTGDDPVLAEGLGRMVISFRRWLVVSGVVLAAFLVASLAASLAYAATLDSKEAETMTLTGGAAVTKDGKAVKMNANQESATWSGGGHNTAIPLWQLAV